MEEIKKTVIEYLKEQVEIFEQMTKIKNLLKEGTLTQDQEEEKLTEIQDLMSRAHRYAENGQLKEILFSEPCLAALVLLTNFAIEDFKNINSAARIVDYKLFVKQMAASVLDGMFNHVLNGSVKMRGL